VQDAVAVHESLDLVARRRKVLRDALVGDDHATSRCEEQAHRAQDVDELGNVVDRLEDGHEVIAAPQSGGRLRRGREAHALLQIRFDRVRSRELDRGLVEVDPVDGRIRVRGRDRQAREAGSAGDVGDARRWVRAQALGFEIREQAPECVLPLVIGDQRRTAGPTGPRLYTDSPPLEADWNASLAEGPPGRRDELRRAPGRKPSARRLLCTCGQLPKLGASSCAARTAANG